MKRSRITNLFLLSLLLSVFLFSASASHHEEVQQPTTTQKASPSTLSTSINKLLRGERTPKQAPVVVEEVPAALPAPPAPIVEDTTTISPPPPLSDSEEVPLPSDPTDVDTPATPAPIVEEATPPLPFLVDDNSEEVPLPPPSPSDVAPLDVVAAEDPSSHADENQPEDDTTMTMDHVDMEASGDGGVVVKQEPAEDQCPVGQCPYNCATDDSGDFSCFCGPCGDF